MHNEFGFLIFLGGMFGIIGLFIVPIVWLAMRSERHKRDLQHTERMRALELGHGLPDDEVTARIKAFTGTGSSSKDDGGPGWCMVRRCYWMGFALPVGAFLGTTYLAPHRPDNTGIWVATAIIGTASVLSGTILAFRMTFLSNADESRSAALAGRVSKPTVDPDTFDVAARRG
jgi:hypothetical protein